MLCCCIDQFGMTSLCKRKCDGDPGTIAIGVSIFGDYKYLSTAFNHVGVFLATGGPGGPRRPKGADTHHMHIVSSWGPTTQLHWLRSCRKQFIGRHTISSAYCCSDAPVYVAICPTVAQTLPDTWIHAEGLRPSAPA